MYIGDVYVPAITEASLDSQQQTVKQFKALGLSHPVSVSFAPPNIRRATLKAALYAVSPKTANDFAKDLLALLRPAGYNYFEFADHKGLLEIEHIDTPLPAESQLLREASIYGLFFPDAHYIRRIKTSPAVLTNDFSLTLSSDGVDSIVWLPAGASVVAGGDGTTYTRTTKDGSITGVLAESTTHVDFDGCNEHDVGEVKVWDECDEASESNWKRVLSTAHDFEGDCVIENGLVRLRIKEGATEVSHLYVYRSGSWQDVGEVRAQDASGSLSYIRLSSIDTLNPDEVVATVQFNNGTTYVDTELTLKRGEYLIRFKPSADLDNIRIRGITDKRYAFVEGDTIVDAWEEASSSWKDGSNTDNYAVLFAATNTQLIVLGSTDNTIQAYADAGSDLITSIGSQLAAGSSCFLGAVPFAYTLQHECENMTKSGTWTDVSDSGASAGYYTKSSTAGDSVRTDLTWGTDLPQGHYRVAVRAKVDATGDTDGLRLTIYNTTDSRYMLESGSYEYFTPTTSWAWYTSGLFEVQSGDEGDTGWIRFDLNGTSHEYHLDEYVIIPVSNGNYLPQDLTHQALVNQHIKRQVVQR